MMLAHYVWERTPRGAPADERSWVAALDQAASDSAPLMRAIWRALTVNERRASRALAVVCTPLYSEETATAVAIKRTSIRKALESLVANADVIEDAGGPRLTDPMFEFWLQTRGLTPAAGARTTSNEDVADLGIGSRYENPPRRPAGHQGLWRRRRLTDPTAPARLV